MEVFHDLTGNIMYDLQGRIMAKNPIPSIDLEHESKYFPPRSTNIGYIRLSSQGANIIYIDFGDGSPIYSQSFSGLLNIPDESLHEYETVERRMTRIWFEYPQLVSEFRLNLLAFIGNFPLNLGLYSFELLSIRNTRFDAFPIEFIGGVFRLLTLDRVTQMTITYIPQWIINSKIRTLNLHGGIELDNDTTNSIESVINIQGLEIISLGNTGLNDIPSNFKDINTLRSLRLGNNPFTEITQNVNDCKQLTELVFGYYAGSWTGGGSNLFTSWGVGIGNMPELQVFRFDRMEQAPDTLPTGIETAPKCKTIWASTNRTQHRQDTFIENVYNQVISTATMATGEGVLRRITLRIEGTSYLRPSGVYQAPSGYVQGADNGAPASPMEMIYVLVNQYEWTFYVTDEAGTGTQILTP